MLRGCVYFFFLFCSSVSFGQVENPYSADAFLNQPCANHYEYAADFAATKTNSIWHGWRMQAPRNPVFDASKGYIESAGPWVLDDNHRGDDKNYGIGYLLQVAFADVKGIVTETPRCLDLSGATFSAKIGFSSVDLPKGSRLLLWFAVGDAALKRFAYYAFTRQDIADIQRDSGGVQWSKPVKLTANFGDWTCFGSYEWDGPCRPYPGNAGGLTRYSCAETLPLFRKYLSHVNHNIALFVLLPEKYVPGKTPPYQDQEGSGSIKIEAIRIVK